MIKKLLKVLIIVILVTIIIITIADLNINNNSYSYRNSILYHKVNVIRGSNRYGYSRITYKGICKYLIHRILKPYNIN